MTDKVNVSSIVSSQFPSFIREDYEAFVAFVKAYYEFLQQDYSTDLKTIRDIDTTLDEYIKHFKSEYASNIPFTLANERFVLSNIKDLNLAKGSEQSYRLLFRLLFDKEIQIGYPGQQMLRASDGRWEQKVSIFVGVVAGDVDKIVNNVVEIITSTGPIRTLVYSYKNLQLNIDGRSVYELSIDRRFFGNIAIDDRVTLDGDFIARVVPTIAKFKVIQAGKNFKVGELYEIGTTGTILKIIQTDQDGAITFAQIIKYGMDKKFTGDFIYELVSKTDLAKNLAISHFTIMVPGISASKDVGMNDASSGFSEYGAMNTYDYNVDIVDPALDGTYAGKIFRTFSDSSISTEDQIDPNLLAYVTFTIGGVSKYPGYFTSNAGFLDDSMYIQDSKFYQQYSYLITIDEKLSAYKSAVKTLVHPAGVALFGEYTIINEFDLGTELDSMLKSLIVILKDKAIIIDSKGSFDVAKPLANAFDIADIATIHTDKQPFEDILDPVTDESVWDFGKGLTEDQTVEDLKGNFEIGKGFFDLEFDAPVVEDAKDNFAIDKPLSDLVTADDTPAINTSKPFEDTLDPLTDESTWNFGKGLTEAPEVTDAKDYFAIDKPLSDSVTATETRVFDVEKVKSDSMTATDAKDHFVVGKVFTEAPEITDAKDHFVIGKVLTDILVSSDEFTFLSSKSKTDSVAATDTRAVDLTKSLSDSITLSENVMMYLNGSALYYKYDVQALTDNGAVWKNAYLEDMSTFANDGADYMENKIAVF